MHTSISSAIDCSMITTTTKSQAGHLRINTFHTIVHGLLHVVFCWDSEDAARPRSGNPWHLGCTHDVLPCPVHQAWISIELQMQADWQICKLLSLPQVVVAGCKTELN